MKTYQGNRFEGGNVVTVDDRPLPVRLDLVNHSPTGFEWGYGGSGPAQLALAILADHLGPGGENIALDVYQAFKLEVVAHLARAGWMLTTAEIDAWIAWWAAEGKAAAR